MPDEMVCAKHGPYDASYGSCPYCQAESGGRPMAPAPLDEDELPTDLGASPYQQGGGYDDEGPTDLGVGHGQPGFLDLEADEETELGRQRQPLDVTEVEDVETGALAILWVKDGLRRGRIHKVDDGTLVGRSQGDLILDDPKVSNPHARFRIEDDEYVLWDFGSRNGTFVNGEKIRAATPLKENDEVKLGNTTYVFKILPKDE